MTASATMVAPTRRSPGFSASAHCASSCRSSRPTTSPQAELERDGLRLAAPLGNRFPSRAEPGGPNTRAQELVFVGHFAIEDAARCVPERQERCENTFVVTDYDELFR